MRKFLIPLAAAAATVAIAAPAAAQVRISVGQPAYGYAPYGYAQQGYGYAPQAYGQRYGYNNYGQAQQTKMRIDRIQAEIRRLAQYRMISRSEYNNRIRESREIERRFYRNARDGRGLTRNEMYDVQQRVARLEYRLQRDVRDGRQWGYRW